MKRLEEFRIYYNQTIHPELVRMERLRLRLLRLLFFSALMLLGVILLELYLNILVVTLFMALPIGFYIAYLISRMSRFRNTFKPHVVNLIIDFINDQMSYRDMVYDGKGSISKDMFQSSRIFITDAPFYQGEDYIKGKRGDVDFELCELVVHENSNVRNDVVEIFRGIFLHATFSREMTGEMIIWPKNRRQYLTRSIREFTWNEAENVEDEIMVDEFKEAFLVYAKREQTIVHYLLPESLQQSILQYRAETNKDIYLSFIGKEIYAAITEPKDILEPYIFQSNLSFDLVYEFFNDLQIALSIVEDFDNTH